VATPGLSIRPRRPSGSRRMGRMIDGGTSRLPALLARDSPLPLFFPCTRRRRARPVCSSVDVPRANTVRLAAPGPPASSRFNQPHGKAGLRGRRRRHGLVGPHGHFVRTYPAAAAPAWPKAWRLDYAPQSSRGVGSIRAPNPWSFLYQGQDHPRQQAPRPAGARQSWVARAQDRQLRPDRSSVFLFVARAAGAPCSNGGAPTGRR